MPTSASQCKEIECQNILFFCAHFHESRGILEGFSTTKHQKIESLLKETFGK
jgi:hypothetical protein